MKKKTIIRLVIIVLFILLCFGGYGGYRRYKIRNVFDEMYYAAIKTNTFLTRTRFHDMEPLRGCILGWEAVIEKEILMGVYPEKYLRIGEELLVGSLLETQCIEIIFTVYYEEESVELRGYYRVYDKTLEYENISVKLPSELLYTDDPKEVEAFLTRHNITKEEIEAYKHYFLYEKVIIDWCEGNGRNSRFTADRTGSFEVIDETYGKLSEEWKD